MTMGGLTRVLVLATIAGLAAAATPPDATGQQAGSSTPQLFGGIARLDSGFCHQENGKQECRVFQFAHVWRRSGDGWQMTRVLSYGH
jgi:hypothetical protein